jgi:DNA-binding NtrC family response regulator
VDLTVAAARRSMQVQGGTLRVGGVSGGAALTIGAEPRIVGRSPECDLSIDDPKLSAVHLELVATDGGVRVRDLGSRNGTLLAGHRVVEAFLTSDVTLTCGDTQLSFRPTKPEQVPLSRRSSFGPLVGSSAPMRRLFENLRVLAKASLSVLVLGETGTGKELVARAIHEASPRKNGPFVVVDCGAIPPSLAESALFGHERGAFTGAVAKHVSPFVEAHGGTIFLDELGELPLDLQPKLLRVLAERRVKSVGASTYVDVDVRVVCATRRDVLKEVNDETFRSDLYFRIAQAKAVLPPLRDRREDIPALLEHLFGELGAPDAFARLTPDSLDRADRYDWPGNVRELKNVVLLALAYDTGGPIDLGAHLSSSEELGRAPRPRNGGGSARAGQTFAEAKLILERTYFQELYAECAGNVSEMARRADVDRKTVRECLKRHRVAR